MFAIYKAVNPRKSLINKSHPASTRTSHISKNPFAAAFIKGVSCPKV